MARRAVREEAANAVRDVLGRGGLCNGLFVTDVLTDVWNRGKSIEQQVTAIIASEANEYDAVIYQDGNGLWLSEGGQSSLIPDPNTLNGIRARLAGMGKRVLDWPGGDVDLPGAFGRREADAQIPGPDAPPPPATYTVVAGDTFSGIATKLGVTSDALATANPQVVDINQISIGQVLNIPK